MMTLLSLFTIVNTKQDITERDGNERIYGETIQSSEHDDVVGITERPTSASILDSTM
jgi:hypothetical protein